MTDKSEMEAEIDAIVEKRWKEMAGEDYFRLKDCEIICNIYENPELLKP